MSFKTDMGIYLTGAKEKIGNDLKTYVSIGKNPLDVLYDTSKMESSIECIDEVITDIDKLDDNDSVCSVEIPINLNKRLNQKVEERKVVVGDSGDEEVIKQKSKINGHISALDDMLAMAGYYASTSARALFNKNNPQS